MRKVSLSIVIAGWMLWSGLSECVAQNLPININVTLTPPHSIYLSDYSQIGRDPLRVQILLNDFNAFNVKTKLHVRIENSRGTIRLRTRDAYQPPEGLFLDGGIPLFISGGDLAPYMSYETMEVSGINTNELRRSGGKLPEDLYKFCFQVRDFNRNVALSNEACGEAWLALNEPPLLNFPSNKESVRASYPQNVVFQWVPGRLSPNSAFAIEYKFELFEMMVPNIDPNIIAQRSIPIYEEVVMGTRLLYDMTKPDLVLGRQYAYRVTAQNANNFDGARSLFKNEGRSVVHTFTYGEECRPLKDVDASDSNSSTISMDWGADVTGLYSEYDVRYRKKGRGDWTTESSYFNSHRIDGLAEGLTFEVSARGVCGTVTSEWSPHIEVSTPTAAQAEAERLESVNCGVEPKPSPISNRKPLSTLTKGRIVKTGGGFEMLVTKASGNNGTFSGEGIVSVPMMAGGGMIVKFDGIKVNDEYRHYGGKIQSMYDKQGKGIADLNKYKEDAGVNNVVQNKNVEKKNTDNKAVDPTKLTDANGAKPDKVEKVEGKIKEVKKNEKGEVVVVKEDGSEEVIKTEEGKSTEIVDSEGNKHTVGKDGSISKGTPAVGEGLAGGTGGVTGGSRGGSGSSSSSEEEIDVENVELEALSDRDSVNKTSKITTNFEAHPEQIYGFDNSNPSDIWKSIEVNKTDKVVYSSKPDSAYKLLSFETKGLGIESVSPEYALSPQQDIVLKSNNTGVSELKVIDTLKDKSVNKLNVVSYFKKRKNLTIIVLHEENDDVQVTELGVKVEPATVCIHRGDNNFLDTRLSTSKDDRLNKNGDIIAGQNGFCDTKANNNDKLTQTRIDVTDLEKTLNKDVYSQAVFEWDVQEVIELRINYDLDKNGYLEIITSNIGVKNSPSRELEKLKKDLLDLELLSEDQRYYMIVTDYPDPYIRKGSLKDPFGLKLNYPGFKKFNFSFGRNTQGVLNPSVNLTIAHELGHAAFNLRDNRYKFSKRNLMNYTNLKNFARQIILIKKQWDLIQK